MNIITITNQKGGVAKTTTACSLAFMFAKYNKKVLLIDLDQQGNASYLLRSDPSFKNIYNVLVDDLDIRKSIQKYYDSEYLGLISFDKKLSLIDLVLNEVNQKEMLLNNAILNIKNSYDYIIIDTPPALNLLTINAFISSNYIIIPTNTEMLSLQGIGQLYNTINAVKVHKNPDLKVLGFLVTKHKSNTKVSQHFYDTLVSTAKKFETTVFKYVIREGVKIQESQAFRERITKDEYKDGIGITEYDLIAKLIIEKLEN